ncbi:MAG TPA: hypothetical protein VFM02_04100, partial [Candidatus Paceibacterota bacterium]|nr:hypothetical protein [Candidatus Paceibacterota bacterium]
MQVKNMQVKTFFAGIHATGIDLNNWLSKCGDIEILHIEQSVDAQRGLITLVIFYRPKTSIFERVKRCLRSFSLSKRLA